MEFFNIETITGVALSLAGAYFLGIPLLILVNQRMAANPEIVEFDESATLPEVVSDYFYACEQELTEAGFERAASIALPDPVPNVRAILQIYFHQPKSTACMVTAMFGLTEGGPPLQTRYVEFVTRFRGGELEMVQTNNSTEVNAFAEVPESPTFRLPHVTDVARLANYHEQLVDRTAPGTPRSLAMLDEFGGDVVEYLRVKAFKEAYERQVETGYLRYDSGQDCYRPTLGGAYKMTWKNLWPIKPLILARTRAAGKRLETELDRR